MRRTLVVLLLAVAGLPGLGWGAPGDVPWTVLLEVPVNGKAYTEYPDGSEERSLNHLEGFGLSVVTPLHVGFGFESFTGELELAETLVLDVTTTFLTVFVEFPVTFLRFHVGGGWGQFSFDPDSVADDEGTRKLEAVNLWEWFARLGIPLPWDLSFYLGYREAHGRATNRNREKTPIDTGSADITVQTMTVGLGYTF